MKTTSLKPLLVRVTYAQYASLSRFAKKLNVSMNQIVREAIEIRLAKGDYLTGFNDGLGAAIDSVNSNRAAQMRFPSGKSFAELVSEDIKTKIMQGEKDGQTTDTRATEGASSSEGQSDQSLGL
jgi:hypothetical protein